MQNIIDNNMVALARKRAANKRSQMLKMIMPHLSHDNGEALANAISMKNAAKFKAVWEQIKREIVGKLEHFKSHSSAFDVEEFYDTVMLSISSDTQILNGSGELKEGLRTLMVEGVLPLTPTHTLRIFQLHANTTSKSALSSVTFEVRTEIYDSSADSIVKSFAGKGKLAATLLDQLLLALSYTKK
jgi:hypothetical protein